MTTSTLPAVLGGPPAFPDGLPLVRPTIPDIPGLAQRLQSILESGILTNHRTVRELEERVAERCQVAHVVAVNSCTQGLMLTLRALGATGRVVMPSFTFAASAHAVHWVGGRPDWAEVDPRTMTLDPDDADALVEGAAAMTATHVYGAPCRVEELQAVADRAGIPLVYDSAHALGSRRGGVPCGGFGTAEVFSMSPTKVAVAGEGGLVATDDEGLAAEVRLGREYGNPGTYDCEFAGLNARMSELHAAVGLASLQGLDERIAYRNELVGQFKDATAGVAGLAFQDVPPEDVSTYKDLTLVVDEDRFGMTAEQVGRALKAEGIDSRRYYFPPIHQQKAYAHLPRTRELAVTDALATTVLTSPLYSHMTVGQVRSVADTVVRLHEAAPQVRSALA